MRKTKFAGLVLAAVLVLCVVLLVVIAVVIVPASRYSAALGLYNEGRYEEAKKAFQALKGYNDSAEQVARCETAILDGKYDAAAALAEAGRYEEAAAAFQTLKGYKDSAEQIAKCEDAVFGDLFLAQKAGLASVSAGSTVRFGRYEQDNIPSNGKEEIEWLVLAKEGGRALLVSRYALDGQEYDVAYEGVTWETCTLRQWLNEDFYNAAFGSAHQDVVVTSLVEAERNLPYSTSPGNDTEDKVFLLSITEAYRYFDSDEARQCQGTPYCFARRVYKGTNGNCWWWLRSPGYDSSYAARVSNEGTVQDHHDLVYYNIQGVRPAIWIEVGE